MASPVSTELVSGRVDVKIVDLDPNLTTAVESTWFDMRDYDRVMFIMYNHVGTPDANSFKIVGNSSSTGADTDVTIKSHALGTAVDAVGDYVFLECTKAELRKEGLDASPSQTDLRYVAAQVAYTTSTNECTIVCVRMPARHTYPGLTADTIA